MRELFAKKSISNREFDGVTAWREADKVHDLAPQNKPGIPENNSSKK